MRVPWSRASASSSSRQAIYETCSRDRDCTLDADLCAGVTVEYSNSTIRDAICTVDCRDDADCPYSYNGEPGGCYSQDIGRDDTSGPPICFERCFDDRDCLEGFRCLDSTQLLIDRGDSICVPG